MAKIDAEWNITLEPSDVIGLAQGLGVDAWPDDDDGMPVRIKPTMKTDMNDEQFMAWLEDQNWHNLRMLNLLKSWYDALELHKDSSKERRGEMMSIMHSEVAELLRELKYLKDDEYHAQQAHPMK